MTPSGRSWEWAPSPFANRVVSLLLHIPLLNRVASNDILVLTFTGVKSGKRHSTPVGYLPDGEGILILTKRFRAWWHNFQVDTPVEVQLRGKHYRAKATLDCDDASITRILVAAIKMHPYYANYYNVRLIKPGEPDLDNVRAVAAKIVVLHVKLDR